MKNFFQSLKCAALLLAFAIGLAPIAHAQVSSATFIAVTNQPAIVTTTASSNIVSWVKLNTQSGLGLQWQFNQASASTSNATLVVYASIDGTNISTVPFASLTAASTGATDVIVNTNWSRAQLEGIDSLIIGKIQNTTALTTLTNKAIIVRRSPY